MFSIPFQVEKSITIKKSPNQIYDVTADFETWPRWSPRPLPGPECRVVVKGTKGSAGHSQEWEGDVIGAGNIELIEVRANQSLE